MRINNVLVITNAYVQNLNNNEYTTNYYDLLPNFITVRFLLLLYLKVKQCVIKKIKQAIIKIKIYVKLMKKNILFNKC